MAANILVDSTLSIYNMGQNAMPLTQANTTQIGYFEANDTTFPVQSGIVMVAAQNASDVISATNGTGNNVTFTDAELSSVLTQLGSSGYAIKDMVQIEFSFIAQSDSIMFNYCFGSHEYDGYTCSNFNDVFGFFLEGPYINGVVLPSTVPWYAISLPFQEPMFRLLLTLLIRVRHQAAIPHRIVHRPIQISLPIVGIIMRQTAP